VSGSINFVTLVRALGPRIGRGNRPPRLRNDPEVVKFMLENLEEAEVQTDRGAIEKPSAKRVASGQGKNYQLKRANYVIDRYLLPHLHEEGVEEEGRPDQQGPLPLSDGRGLFRTRAPDGASPTTRTTTRTSGSRSAAT